MTEDDNGSDNSQFTGSTINLQDLEWPPQSCRSQDSCDDRPHRHVVTVHSLHQQIHPFPRTFESIFGHVVRGGGGHEFTDDAPWEEEMDKGFFVQNIIMFISKAHFVPKSNLRAFLCQRDMWEAPCFCVLWVSTVLVSIPWCHIATHAHTVCCLCSSCLTDTSRCAFLHWWVICFICCYFDFLCFVRFIFLWQQYVHVENMPVHVFIYSM